MVDVAWLKDPIAHLIVANGCTKACSTRVGLKHKNYFLRMIIPRLFVTKFYMAYQESATGGVKFEASKNGARPDFLTVSKPTSGLLRFLALVSDRTHTNFGGSKVFALLLSKK